jgi:hypothetical protein
MDEFTWIVNLDGYEALRISDRNPPDDIAGWLIAEKGPAVHRRVRSYKPLLECAGFHRTFAATEPTISAAIAFTNRYGFLGDRITKILQLPTESGPFQNVRGELLTDWYSECQALREALRLWDTISSQNHHRFSSFGERHREEMRSESGGASVSGDLTPAGSHLQSLVNTKIDELNINTRVVWDLDRAWFKSALVPQGLLGALWADLANAIGTNRGREAYQKCASCGMFFEKSTSKRRDARYCSDACKSRAYRHREAAQRD